MLVSQGQGYSILCQNLEVEVRVHIRYSWNYVSISTVIVLLGACTRWYPHEIMCYTPHHPEDPACASRFNSLWYFRGAKDQTEHDQPFPYHGDDVGQRLYPSSRNCSGPLQKPRYDPRTETQSSVHERRFRSLLATSGILRQMLHQNTPNGDHAELPAPHQHAANAAATARI